MHNATPTQRHVPIHVPTHIDRLKNILPGVWERFNKKRYRNAERFHDYRLPQVIKASYFAAVHLSKIGYEAIQSSEEAKRDFFAIEIGQKYDFPTYFVEREIMQACLATDLTEPVDLGEMKLPFPMMTFILPKDFLTLKGEDICYLEICRVTPADVGLSEGPKQIQLSGTLSSGGKLFKNIRDVFDPKREIAPKLNDPYCEKIDIEDGEIIDSIARSVCNLLFIMAARPDYVEAGRRQGFHKKSKSELWTPNVIGKNYRIKTKAQGEGGTNGTKRFHWRRGHFRHQAFGPQLMERKTIWIEPMMVGIKGE
jgi:hypothetical protein